MAKRIFHGRRNDPLPQALIAFGKLVQPEPSRNAGERGGIHQQRNQNEPTTKSTENRAHALAKRCGLGKAERQDEGHGTAHTTPPTHATSPCGSPATHRYHR